MGAANQTRDFIPGPSRAIGPAPTRGIAPGPSSGTYSSYLTNNFPLGQENPADACRKRAPLCKGSWPAGPEELSSPFHETRRNILAKEDCNFASWMRHWRPHTGRRQNAVPRMQGIRGKRKNKRWENVFSQPLFLSFSLCPCCCHFSSPPSTCGNNLVRYDCMSHTGCRGDTPAAGYRGCVSPCLVTRVQGARSPLLR